MSFIFEATLITSMYDPLFLCKVENYGLEERWIFWNDILIAIALLENYFVYPSLGEFNVEFD